MNLQLSTGLFSIGIFLVAPLLAQREHGFDNTKPSGQPYLSPEESIKRMKVPDGFEVKLFAAEPDVVNPIAFTVDEKGRVWVVENFEYPSRTPPGKAPRDRIIILEDTDGDGKADKRTVFAEGKDFPVMKERADKGLGAFDLATGLEVGHGGVFIGAPPYLWFIENKNDKPGKFEALLKGFGSHDTHETLNTFQWGPDGRLYGLHGVFTHSEVAPPHPQPLSPQGGEGSKTAVTAVPPKGNSGTVPPSPPGGRGVGGEGGNPPVRMNAAVWRYDVRTRKFEIFAEGTSNPWGMDFDSQGNCFLCCCVIPHLFHIVPGGIYKRQAGASFNPYAYGYLNEICDHTFHKESGWAHAGLLCLDNPNVPEEFRTSVIFGSIHGCSIKRNTLKRNGSTFTASKAPDFLVSGDKNFRPINLRWAPDGSILIIDWHDQNPCHQAKPDAWDKTHGRVYRVQRKGEPRYLVDASERSNEQLITAIEVSGNPWWRRTALRLIDERQSGNETDPIGAKFDVAAGKITFNHTLLFGRTVRTEPRTVQVMLPALVLMKPSTASSRSWLIQETASLEKIGPEFVRFCEAWARLDSDPGVQLTLASVSQRLANGHNVLQLVHRLMMRKENAADPVIPLMLWYAYEKPLAAKPQAELEWLAKNAPGNPLITDHIIGRAMRRLTATGKTEDLAACVAFVGELKHDDILRHALEGLVEGLKGRPQEPPAGWEAVHARLMKHSSPNIRQSAEQIAVSLKNAQAITRAVATLRDASRPKAERLQAIQVLTPLKPLEALFPLIDIVLIEKDEELRRGAATALGAYNAPVIVERLLPSWKTFPDSVRGELVNGFKSHQNSARLLLDAVGKGTVPRTDLTDNTILAIRAFNNRDLNAQIEKVWGRYRPSPADLEKLIAGMHAQVKEKPGDAAKGKLVFQKNCLQCHKFENQGHDVGPALDGADRSVDYLLVNVLDPNRVIGQPYYQKVVLLKNGQVKTGLLHGEDESTLTLKREQAALEIIQKKEIDESKTVEKSLMPEGLDKNITPEEFRHLVEYLRRK